MLVLMSHLGRPKGEVVDDAKMDPVAKEAFRASRQAGNQLNDCIGPEVKEKVMQMKPGDVVLLENTRFHKGETKNDPEMSRRLCRIRRYFR